MTTDINSSHIQRLRYKVGDDESFLTQHLAIRDRFDILKRVYVSSNHRFYDPDRYILSAAKFNIEKSQEAVFRFIRDKRMSISISYPDEILTNNDGYLATDVFDKEEMYWFGNSVDMMYFAPFFDETYLEQQSRSLDSYFISEQHKLKSGIYNHIAPIYPLLISEPSFERDVFMLSRTMGTFEHSISDLVRHSTIFAGALALQVKFELHAHYIKNEALLSRLILTHRSRDTFGRSDWKTMLPEVKKVLKSSGFSRDYAGFAEDVSAVNIIYSKSKMENGNKHSNAGVDFELECISSLESHGFYAYLTATTGDFGADIIAEKANLTYCIQCKAHSDPIGIKAVQEVTSARQHYNCDYAVIISITKATSSAHRLAQTNEVAIITRSQISILDRLF